jgi:glycosyltransferase involved in cell wall biosynthesis
MRIGRVAIMEEQATGTTARVGVVTPSLNAERYLDRTMESIWSQASDGLRIDHVLVDGGSTDATLEIAARYPSRTVVATDDRGMYDAINRGFALVEGDIVGYMNADDEIAPGALRSVAAAFAAHPEAPWLCGTVEYIDGSDEVLGRMTPVSMSLRSYVGIGWSPIPQQTVWARRSFYDEVGPFDTTFKNTGDYDWYARALALSRPLILKETLGRFRLHGAQLSFDPEKMARESRLVQERHGGRDGLTYLSGKLLSLRLNASNPRWLVAKKTGRIRFTN